jgi:hypothetical protein
MMKKKFSGMFVWKKIRKKTTVWRVVGRVETRLMIQTPSTVGWGSFLTRNLHSLKLPFFTLTTLVEFYRVLS